MFQWLKASRAIGMNGVALGARSQEPWKRANEGRTWGHCLGMTSPERLSALGVFWEWSASA